MPLRRYPLSIHISTLFLILMSLFSTVLIIVSFHYTHTLLESSAKALSQENSKKIESRLRENMAPIFSTLDYMAYSNIVHGDDLGAAKWRWLAGVHQTFLRNPAVTALYFGSDTGNFTMIRPLFNDQIKQLFKAPPSAVLYLNKTNLDGTSEVFFFNDKIQQIDFSQTQDNTYDPRSRPWYQSSINHDGIVATEPYLFYFLKTYGITFSRQSADKKHVVGVDFTLDSLSGELAAMVKYPSTKMIIFDSRNNPIAQHNTDLTLSDNKNAQDTALRNSIFNDIYNRFSPRTIYEDRDYDGEMWSVSLTPIQITPTMEVRLVEAIRHQDILSKLLIVRNTQIALSIGLLIVCFVIVLAVSRRIAKPMTRLVELTQNIAHFDFKKTLYPQTMITELNNLTHSIQLMEHTISDLIKLLHETAANNDFESLAKTITQQSYVITKAETIILYSYHEEMSHFSVAANQAIIPFRIDFDVLINSTPWLFSELRQGNTVHLQRHDNLLRRFEHQLFNSDIYLFPLLNREGQLIGVLNVGYERSIDQYHLQKHAFLKELLSFAEIAKNNIDRIQQQKDMFSAFVELIASAVDTKSPFTGGHCQRVPYITQALAQVTDEDQKYFPQFMMTQDRWTELNLASWLHDCGKITTPEYVIDKATKLETIHDRIHEIRTRVEVLKSQAETDYWRNLYQGGNQEELDKQLTQTLQELDDDFAFIAECNEGSEQLSDAAVARLHVIAERRWKRTIDDRIGISWIEKQRLSTEPQVLPVMEPLLCDKEAHRIPWDNNNVHFTEQQSFNLKPGELRYNRGELYNLAVRSGTLTPEERFIINDHIIQTIMMLRKLPYPQYLRQVPEIAGSHHEQVNGQGYPLGLTGKDMSVQARIMAIADVFEALTSSDRPYKKAKTLSESLSIMTNMATSGHLDPKLYVLFLEQEVYLDYAAKHLDEAQCDDVDKAALIKQTKNYIRHEAI